MQSRRYQGTTEATFILTQRPLCAEARTGEKQNSLFTLDNVYVILIAIQTNPLSPLVSK